MVKKTQWYNPLKRGIIKIIGRWTQNMMLLKLDKPVPTGLASYGTNGLTLWVLEQQYPRIIIWIGITHKDNK